MAMGSWWRRRCAAEGSHSTFNGGTFDRVDVYEGGAGSDRGILLGVLAVACVVAAVILIAAPLNKQTAHIGINSWFFDPLIPPPMAASSWWQLMAAESVQPSFAGKSFDDVNFYTGAAGSNRGILIAILIVSCITVAVVLSIAVVWLYRSCMALAD